MIREANHPDKNELKKIFNSSKKIFFIGIGGISMSSIAEYCVYLGKEVYGYDRERNEACRKLERVAKQIKYCSTPDNASHMDLVVYTSAIDESNFEMQCAIREGLPLVTRSELLGCIMADYKERIGIAGMHGKSTVTSLIAHIYEYASLDPTVMCGAVMKDYLSPYKFGGRDNFIFEACEYKDAFHDFCPTDAIILNIDYDHPDYFKSMEQIISSFKKYADRARRVFINADDKMSKSLELHNKALVSFGLSPNSDYSARNISLGECCDFTVYRGSSPLVQCKMRQSGIHTVYNGLCAFSVAYENGIDKEAICDALYSFRGSERRLEYYKKSQGGGDIYIDYAHHPKEISATLNGLSHMGYKNILCVFQPHTYSRTYALYKEFTGCFSVAKRLIITDIYPAREENIYGIKAEELAREAKGEYISDFKKIADVIATSENDAIVIMGAGDIIKIKKFM
ncbi:MAG: UDP-N-acetylmuramate--L-alanine ligase [Clostridia bacterium]|nr:UDP-N-acetylmuramate--L-alanine ligase [Clostridia bacterium]